MAWWVKLACANLTQINPLTNVRTNQPCKNNLIVSLSIFANNLITFMVEMSLTRHFYHVVSHLKINA